MSLNIITHLNIPRKILIFNPELNRKQKLLSTKQRDPNLFNKYNIGNNEFSGYFTGDNKLEILIL